MPEHILSKLGESSVFRLNDAERATMRQGLLLKIREEKSVRPEPEARLSGDMDMTTSLITGFKDMPALFLGQGEKSAMLQALRLKTHHSLPSPSPSLSFFSPRLFKLAGVFGAFLIGISGAAAAEYSLPGQLLYPVKINVNENVRAGLRFTTTSRASWNVDRVGRRLKEAEALAQRMELTLALAGDIGTQVSADTSLTERSIAQVKHEGKVAAALELSNRFHESLDAYEVSLSRIVEKNEPSRPAVERVLVSVSALTESRVDGEAEKPTVAGAATGTTATIPVSATAGTTVMKEVETSIDSHSQSSAPSSSSSHSSSSSTSTDTALVAKAESHISAAAKALEGVESTLGVGLGIAVTVGVAEEKAAKAASVLSEAKSKLKAKDYKGAMLSADASLALSLEAQASLTLQSSSSSSPASSSASSPSSSSPSSSSSSSSSKSSSSSSVSSSAHSSSSSVSSSTSSSVPPTILPPAIEDPLDDLLGL